MTTNTDAAEARAVLSYVGKLLSEVRRRSRLNGGSWSTELESCWALAMHRQEPTNFGAAATVSDALCVTYETAATRLAVSKRTVERMVAAGQLQTVIVGGCKRITVADMCSYVESLRPRGQVDDRGAPAA